ncbi:MAG: 4Fe-4S binding protein [Anaerolineales bacterium]|nr:4Fe-4S binding protein [Anaerolineales bacterium]
MKIGSMMNDVMASLFKQPVTERYPFERSETPERLRGHLRWDRENCTGCGLCVMECPAQAIEMIVLDKKAKRYVLRYHVDRCTFCAQCVHTCNRNCLSMSSDAWELAALGREPFTVYYGEPEDIDCVLAGSNPADV